MTKLLERPTMREAPERAHELPEDRTKEAGTKIAEHRPAPAPVSRVHAAKGVRWMRWLAVTLIVALAAVTATALVLDTGSEDATTTAVQGPTATDGPGSNSLNLPVPATQTTDVQGPTATDGPR